MLILVSPFTRNLVFFGAIDALLATWGLYGLTRVITPGGFRSRLTGVTIVGAALVLLAVSSVLAVHYTLKS